jgi:hypothetical protein
MKKQVKFFTALIILGVAACTQQQKAPETGGRVQQSSKRIIHVQGHPHEYLTQLHGGREDAKERIVTGSTADININDIQCWAGSVDPAITPNYIDSAVLVVKWTSRPEIVTDSIYIWGYRWSRISIYNDPVYGPDTSDVHKYTIDMLRAVANADCRFSVMLQNTSGNNFTAGGFGYNTVTDFRVRVPLEFDSLGAVSDHRINFKYTGSPNCNVGQSVLPYDVSGQVNEALTKARAAQTSTTPVETGTGVISHPFNADYGYPAYDYDYWHVPAILSQQPFLWQSGWYKGYWSFYHKNQLSGNFVADTQSITTRELGEHYVDGFVFEDQPLIWPPTHDMSGNYVANGCDCGCTGIRIEEGE